MDISQKLKTLRKAQGLTQSQLADKLYLSRQTISKWETNRSQPDLDSLLLLATIFEVTPQALLTPTTTEIVLKDQISPAQMVELYAEQKERQTSGSVNATTKKFLLLMMCLALFFLAIYYRQTNEHLTNDLSYQTGLVGVTKVHYGEEKDLTGKPSQYIKGLTLEDRTYLDHPTIDELESMALFQDADDAKLRIYWSDIIGYFEKYPMASGTGPLEDK